MASHWTIADLPRISAAARSAGIDFQLAGGATDLSSVMAARDAGAHALILGEALFAGAVDYVATTRMLAAQGAASGG